MELSPKGGFEATGGRARGTPHGEKPLLGWTPHGEKPLLGWTWKRERIKNCHSIRRKGENLDTEPREGKENAKKHINSPYFLRISFRLGLRQRS